MSDLSSRRTALLVAVAAGVSLATLGLRTMVTPTGPGHDALVADAPVTTAATPELAATARDRLQDFRGGQAGPRLTLGSDDVTALLRYSLPEMLPAGVTQPLVVFHGDEVTVETRVATADFSGRAPLATVLGALPDTITVDLVGRLVSGGGRVGLEVADARVGGIRLPVTAVAAIAAEMGEGQWIRRATSGAAPMLNMRLPSGIARVEVSNGRLVLRRDEPMVDQAVDGSDDP